MDVEESFAIISYEKSLFFYSFFYCNFTWCMKVYQYFVYIDFS